MKSNPVGWFEIYVDDLNRAQRFYEAVMDVKLEKLPAPGCEMLAFPMDMNANGAAGALVKMEGFKAGGNSTLVYFISEDCAVEAARAAENGGRIQQEKTSIGEHGFIALVMDTENNMIGIHSMK